MKVRYARRVEGYHGCDGEVAEVLLRGGAFVPSRNPWDWLGEGIYFWEWGEDRAWNFASMQQERGKVTEPAVVGAVIELGRCFDLLDTRFTSDLAQFYPTWSKAAVEAGAKLPRNRGQKPDWKGRFLDCAVFNAYFAYLEKRGVVYDTVRGCFWEGSPLWPGAGVMKESHIQIAVRNPECIIGTFRPSTWRQT